MVDGFLDDPVWTGAIEGKLDLEIREGKRWRESDDFTGSFAAVWRSGSLYLAVQLTDDQVETHAEKFSLRDHLEFYFDIDHTGHKSDPYRYILPIGEDATLSNSPGMFIAWGK